MIAGVKSNRQQRRYAKKLSRTGYKRGQWGDWDVRDDNGFYQGKQEFLAAWVNNVFSVQVFKEDRFKRVGVRRHDESTVVTWSDLQRIKNELFGADVLAVQVLPPESKLVDAANIYWFYVYPDDEILPFRLMEVPNE